MGTDSLMLLIGFTAGQVQLIDPIKKELSKLYNDEVDYLIYIYMTNIFVTLLLDRQF
jgi:uncharacterized membrane protein YcgQ (UPF0703/DUF1980 family)